MARRKKGLASAKAAPPTVVEGRQRARALTAAAIVACVAALAGLVYAVWPQPRRPSLLFITLDTLRADRIGAYGYAGASTPTLDGLAARGVRFAAAQAAVPLTGPSHATIFTGAYPPVHGVRDNVAYALDPRHTTLATLLRRHGYRTTAFVAAYPVAAAFGLSQGFDEYHENFHEIPVPGQGAERPANEVADEVIAWLGRAGTRPVFVWVHLYDPHAPYTPPAPYRERFAGRLYDGEIAFADAQVGRILEALRDSGRDDDTLVVAMADHGESLGDHNENAHGILVYEATLHIPLLLAGPGVPQGRVVPDRVGAVDVLPTVLGLLGLPAPAGLAGRNLGPALAGRPVAGEPLYAESLFGRLNCRWASLRAVTLEDWKLVQGADSELFNLGEDPHETRNRARDDPERLARLKALLTAALAKMAPGGDSARMTAVSPEQEERLRSLGYSAGSGGGHGSLDQPGLPDPRTHVWMYERLQSAMQAPAAAVEEGIAEILEIVARDPGNPYGHYVLASIANRHGRLKLAEKAYARSLELDPERPATRLAYGRLLRDLGRLAESETQLRIAVEHTTADDVRTRASLAETLIARGSLDEAETVLRAAEASEPRHLDVLRAVGLLRVAQGRAQEGLSYLERAAAGREPEPWIEVARVRLELGDAAAALAAAREALSRSPRHPWALAVEGQALLLSGRRSEGLEILKGAIAAGPRRPEVWLTLARAFDQAGAASAAAHCRRQAEAIARS